MELSDIRKEIDAVDAEIKELFQKRMQLADEVAKVKAKTNDAIYKPDREMAIIDNQSAGLDKSIKQEYKALIKRVMEISRKYQYGRTLELRDCLEVDYKTTEPAINKVAMLKGEVYLAEGVSRDKINAYNTHDELVASIIKGESDAGLGIMENIGVDVSDGLHKILINNNLYINKCDIIKDDNNRLKVVTYTPNLIVLPEHNRLKVMFICKNSSGSLASILSMISDYDVNLTEIHSKPYIDGDWNYVFSIEMTASLLVKEDRALIYQLMNETDEFKILGSYYCED